MSMNERAAHDLPKLAAPAQRALASAGIQKLDDIATFTEDEIMRLHGMGPNAMRKIRETLAAKALSFARSRQHAE